MNELLTIEHLALLDGGPTVSLGLAPGQWLGVYGPAGSGKTSLLRILAGFDRSVKGTVRRSVDTHWTEEVPRARRVRPRSLAKRGKGAHFSSLATEALTETRLWEDRAKLLSALSPGQLTAAQLLTPMTSGSPLIFLDGLLDRLDPWVLRSSLRFFRRLRDRGVSLVVSSNRLELVREFDAVIVLFEREVRFGGSLGDLLLRASYQELLVTAEDEPGVRALVAPFSVSIEESEEGLRIKASPGQDLAARLMLEGYGNVHFIVQKMPRVEDVLLSLVR